jgi:hypothetical protein
VNEEPTDWSCRLAAQARNPDGERAGDDHLQRGHEEWRQSRGGRQNNLATMYTHHTTTPPMRFTDDAMTRSLHGHAILPTVNTRLIRNLENAALR